MNGLGVAIVTTPQAGLPEGSSLALFTTDEVRSLLWLSVRDKLLVANPGYLDRFEE